MFYIINIFKNLREHKYLVWKQVFRAESPIQQDFPFTTLPFIVSLPSSSSSILDLRIESHPMGSSRGHTLMEVGPDGVAVITIVNPPVNSLSFDGTITIPTLKISISFRINFVNDLSKYKLNCVDRI